ncbi:hypothetical protein MNEG_6475 [Monoraphidium neglectum]|uniref:Uncharacterized protein n=1 Tax=Monoraphidium neglectum TaxID=145388 RepID=A0A0D2JQU6_9CHLO|nr:hypothetical protein MNEG_6475 [Monoraphidium neglectum]KIZ01488.1 hypothetical protein MNEG_6475 [Monoraphidium neglectum]|eukprot:XP_013900507.1 hypothetical protein MNEG_6475 [Monoraphidium neglectum]
MQLPVQQHSKGFCLENSAQEAVTPGRHTERHGTEPGYTPTAAAMTGEPGVAVEHERVRVEGGPMAGPEGLGAAGTGMGAGAGAGAGLGGGAPLAAGVGAGMGPGEGLAAHEGVGERAAHAAERAAGRAEAAVGPEFWVKLTRA